MSELDPILAEFKQRLGSVPTESLIEEFASRYATLGPQLVEALRQIAIAWNNTPLDESQVDSLCIEFEDQYQNGNTPDIQQWLDRVPKANQAELLTQLITGDVYHRTRRGEAIDWESYKTRFPSMLAAIEQARVQFQIDQRKTPGGKDPADVSTDIFAPDIGLGKLLLNRYRLDRLLGSGAFGTVYLCYDTSLNRQVAIKVRKSNSNRKSSNDDYLEEAQFAAALRHSNIVAVYTVERAASDEVFIVTEYIEGGTLKDHIEAQDFDYQQIALTIASVAEALAHAHQKGLIHRDVKPANILVEANTRKAYVADFGLATREFEYLQKADGAGSPAYKSPEQIRREGHKLDGRSDLFSLGIVFYELLTGNRPFVGSNVSETEKRILYAEPTPPSGHKSDIPAELERICMKLLRKEPKERYAAGGEVAEELRDWLAPQTVTASVATDEAPAKVIPRGLRSYCDEDAGFFLDLLPGLRDVQGLPESVSFWKKKIEQRDPEKTFGVGMLIGPSGSGKSSLVKAAIIPRLPAKIVSIHLDATGEDTEERLLKALKKRFSGLQETSTLTEAMLWIRTRMDPKVVIWLDQFEQWLSAGIDLTRSDLVDALRQCDGRSLQAVLMVRDDFFMANVRLMNALDIRLLERENFMYVDLFDQDHAKKVLVAFGQAYGRIPEQAGLPNDSTQSFIDSAVAGLSQAGKVVSVRLALFAEMVKDKPWETGTLESVGGAQGVGVNFLEETFSARDANPQHRYHAEGAKEVLKALLPSATSDLKGHRRSATELQEVAGYANKPTEFQSLLRILDDDLRLITPSDQQGAEQASIERSYQLTHDYLVPSLREWLTRKQRETKKGRAELKLAERASTWGAIKENKQLPTLWEWLQIRRWTDAKRWTASESALMRTAGNVHLKNWGSALFGLLLVSELVGFVFRQQSIRGQQEKITVALDSLQKTLGPSVEVNIEKLVQMNQPQLIRADLEDRYVKAQGSLEKLSLAFGLARFGRVDAEYLVSQIDSIEDRDTGNLIRALAKDPIVSIRKLKTAMAECTTVELQRRKARLALVALGMDDTDLPIDAAEFERRPDPGVRTWFIDELPRWEIDSNKLVNSVRDSPSPALRSAVCLGIGQRPVKQISSEEKNRISELVTKWYSLPDSSTHSAVTWLMRRWEIPEPPLDDAKKMVYGRNWFINSQGVTFVRITPPRVEHKPLPDPLEEIRKSLAQMENATPEENTKANFRYKRGRSLFLTGKYEAALADFDALLSMELDDSMSGLRGKIAQLRLLALARLKRIEEADAALAQWSASETDDVNRDYIESLVPLWLGRKEVAVARLEKGLANAESLDSKSLYKLACALALFASSEDGSAEEKRTWSNRSLDLLQQWSQDDDSDRTYMREDPDLLALHSDPRFVKLAEDRPTVPDNPYWIANCEVTRGDFEAFMNDNQYQGEKPKVRMESELYKYEETSPTLNHPVQNVSWLDAVMYCNWLSRRQGLTPAYRYVGKKNFKDYDGREKQIDKWEQVGGANGYRLPSELEWEYACRAGSKTDWSSGSDESLLAVYSQTYPSKLTSPSGHKLPNAWGVHDMHGNVWEWCWEPLEVQPGSDRVIRGGCWILGAAYCRSASRLRYYPSNPISFIGFRVALSSPSGIPKSPEADKADK